MKKIIDFVKRFAIFAMIAGVLAAPVFAFAQGGAVVVAPPSFDFGDILQSNGKVSTIFTVTNSGAEALKINRLSTSCGCTTAEMDLSDFAPGESRELKVTFDPQVHEDQFGVITRMVYLQTSDALRPEASIELIGNVIGGVQKQANVFFNEACADCGELVNERYPVFFDEYGIDLVKKDYINERGNRVTLNEYNEKWGVPFELQSHIEAFIGDNLLIGGHVPETIMRYLLEHPTEYDKILVYQDEMHGNVKDYRVWDFEGEIKTYDIDEPITTYLRERESGGAGALNGDVVGANAGFLWLFGIITSSAFIDGINPCAIAVLLFFIAFLFSIKRSKKSILIMGIVYIAAIYLAYFLIGVGIAQAIIISGYPHLMAYVGAYLVIGLGVIQLLTVVFPKFPIRLRIPINTKVTLEKWLYKGTLPAAAIGGFVVGLCTFPCSGGIYVAIIGMLAASQTYWNGFGWMVWYNLVFVAPLIVILLLAANPKTTEKLQEWERKEAKGSKILIGFTMIVVGLIILLFFV